MKISIPFYTILATLLFPCFSSYADQETVDVDVKQPLTVAKLATDTQQTSVDNGEHTSSITETNKSIIKYELVINQLESSGGAYQDGLSENLMGLGSAYQRLEEHANAVTAFKRSLQITRVNSGLHDLSQLPILEQIMQSNFALQNWEGLDENYHYLYWVNRRNYDGKDVRLLPVVNRLGSWHLNAYNLETGQPPFKHLLNADASYTNVVDIIETNYGPSDPRLIVPLYAVALSNFKIAIHATYNSDTEGMKLRNFGSNDRLTKLLNEQKAREDLVHESYKKGKKAMTRVVDIYAENPQLSINNHAEAMILLGDWYLLHNKRHTAMDNYERAYELLNDSGVNKNGIDKLLGKPKSLPAYKIPLEYKKQSDKNSGKNNGNYVLASMDITETGRTRNVKILESNPADNTVLRRRVFKTLRSARFRPRFENGHPVATSDFKVHYAY